MEDFNLVIDFDSTFVKTEALEELAEITLAGKKNRQMIVEEISRITRLGMEGKIPFQVSLEKRLRLLSFGKKQIDELISCLKKSISKSIKENKDFFQNNKKRIYIVSGGFIDFIWPIIKDYGIKKSHVLANKFVFASGGEVEGFDRRSPLSKEHGKALIVKGLGLKGRLLIVGDGYTDLEIKKYVKEGMFFAYMENVRREGIVKEADFVVDDFNQFLYIISKL